MSPRNRILFFLLLTFALSSIFYVRIASEGKLRMLPTLGLMWCPGAAALVVRLVTQRNVRGEGWGWGSTRWQIAAYVLPPVLALIVYGLTWTSGLGMFSPAGLGALTGGARVPLAAIIALLATAGLIQGAVFSAGEEIGWRGFLVPELARGGSSFTATALISGCVWAAYHYPVILTADYHSTTPLWFALIVFTWMIIASSFLYAWLRLKSGSVWTGVILHASHNLFIQEIFDPLTKNSRFTPYVTTEFGVGLAVAYTAAAVYFWRRRAEVEPQRNEAIAVAEVLTPA